MSATKAAGVTTTTAATTMNERCQAFVAQFSDAFLFNWQWRFTDKKRLKIFTSQNVTTTTTRTNFQQMLTEDVAIVKVEDR